MSLVFTMALYLINACKRNDISLAKVLVENKADLNIQDKDGSTALMWACKWDNVKIVKILIDNGANLDLLSEDGWTALMWVCKWDNIELACYTLEYMFS